MLQKLLPQTTQNASVFVITVRKTTRRVRCDEDEEEEELMEVVLTKMDKHTQQYIICVCVGGRGCRAGV